MMKALLIFTTLFIAISSTWAQADFQYEPSIEHPFGLPNPDAEAYINDWSALIGRCQCKSVQRNQDGTWQDTVDMTWIYKYALNGTAIQDVSLKEGLYATSLRQYHVDSNEWAVTFFSYPSVSATPGTWRGGKVGDDIILSLPQKAPNGMDGFSRLTFYDLGDEGYKWKGEWMKDDETVSWPFWKISCRRD